MNTNRPEDRWTSFNHKQHQNASAIWCPWCDDGMSCWDDGFLGARASRPHNDGFPGARASRPHQAWHSLGHLPHLDQPGTAPWLSFGLAAAVPADRVAACSIALKLSGGQRDRMRAGRPRSQGNHSPLEGESQKPSRQAKADAMGGGRRATSQKADVRPLGNSRLPASRAPAPHDGADHSRVKQWFLMAFREQGLCSVKPVCCIGNMDRQDKQDKKLLHRKLTGLMIGSAIEAIQNLHYFRNVGATSCPSWISFFPSCLSSWPFTDPFRVFSNALESLRGLIFYPLVRYFSSFVEIFSPFPTFGGSLLSLLQPLCAPSCPFVDNSFSLCALRGSPSWISFSCFFVDPLLTESGSDVQPGV